MTPAADDATPAPLPANALLAIQLDGSGIELGTISAGTLCRYVDAFRLGLQATIEIVESVQPVQATGRRKRWVERLADLPLVGIESGCVRILLGEPAPKGLFAEAEQESFTRAVDLMFQRIASAAAHDDATPEDSDDQLPRWAEQRLLSIVARLMPPKRGPLKHITFVRRVSGDQRHLASVTLDRRSRQRVEVRIQQQCPEPVRHVRSPALSSYSSGDLFESRP